jgi:hypothetical protein
MISHRAAPDVRVRVNGYVPEHLQADVIQLSGNETLSNSRLLWRTSLAKARSVEWPAAIFRQAENAGTASADSRRPDRPRADIDKLQRGLP